MGLQLGAMTPLVLDNRYDTKTSGRFAFDFSAVQAIIRTSEPEVTLLNIPNNLVRSTLYRLTGKCKVFIENISEDLVVSK
jgi:hypothetical protein